MGPENLQIFKICLWLCVVIATNLFCLFLNNSEV